MDEGRPGARRVVYLATPLLAGIHTHPQQKIFASVIFPQLKWLGRPNRSHVEGKKEKNIEKGEYETDNNDERVKRRIQRRSDDDES